MAKWRINLLGAILTAGLLGGCTTPATRQAPTPGREIVLPLPISAAEVEARSARLAKKLEQTGLGEKEKQVAMTLLNSYQIIGATLEPPIAEGDRQRIIRLLFEALSKMDEEYFLKESLSENAHSKIFSQYSTKRKEIVQNYLAGDHEKVVNQSIGLRDLFGEEALTPDIALLSSISLAKLGRFREALSQGESVARELERRPDLVNLRAYILEWQLAMGQERSAQESLRDLARSVDEKEALLQESRKKMGLEEKATPAPEIEAGPLPAAEGSAAGEQGSLDASLAEVKGLIAKKEYTKAKFLLLQQRIRFPEGAETEAIDQVLRAVELAEGKGDEAPSDQQSAEAAQLAAQQAAQKAVLESERLVLAKKLVEEEKFEEALARLNEFRPDSGVSAEVNSLREVATEKLINGERNRAAKLYLMAKSEGDPVKKEELLVSSFNILKTLLDKYPTSPLKKKISENMGTIKDEMGRMKRRAD